MVKRIGDVLLMRGRRPAAVARGDAGGQADQRVASRIQPGCLDIAVRRTAGARYGGRITRGHTGQPRDRCFVPASAEAHREPPVALRRPRTPAPSSLRLTSWTVVRGRAAFFSRGRLLGPSSPMKG